MPRVTAKLYYWDSVKMSDDEVFMMNYARLKGFGEWVTTHFNEFYAEESTLAISFLSGDELLICEEMFEYYNNPGSAVRRSMSVGDVIVIGETAFLCAPVGWETISLPTPCRKGR
jgi:hypothetical protein